MGFYAPSNSKTRRATFNFTPPYRTANLFELISPTPFVPPARYAIREERADGHCFKILIRTRELARGRNHILFLTREESRVIVEASGARARLNYGRYTSCAKPANLAPVIISLQLAL